MNSAEKVIPVDCYSTFYTPPSFDNSTTKAPIIFIHGFFSSVNTWDKVKPRVCSKTGRQAYAINVRNHGKSGWANEFTVKHLVADLKNFMAKKNIPKAIVVGHSMGGRVALAFALEEPEMVEKLVIEDVNLVEDEAAYEAYRRVSAPFKMVLRSLDKIPKTLSLAVAQERLQEQLLCSWFRKPGRETKQIPAIFPIRKEISGKFALDFNMDVLNQQETETISQFQLELSDNAVFPGETLFISAEHSIINVNKDKDLISKHFPNSKIMRAKDVYHCYHLESEDQYVEDVTNFIGSPVPVA